MLDCRCVDYNSSWFRFLTLRALERNESLGKCVVRNSTIRFSNGSRNCHRGSNISLYSLVTPHLSPPLQARLNAYTGIPIAYPRMVFLENALSSKLNPFMSLARSGSINGLKGFVNKFNGDAELLDDLVPICFSPCLRPELIVVLKNDHWTSKHNKVLILYLDDDFRSWDFVS